MAAPKKKVKSDMKYFFPISSNTDKEESERVARAYRDAMASRNVSKSGPGKKEAVLKVRRVKKIKISKVTRSDDVREPNPTERASILRDKKKGEIKSFLPDIDPHEKEWAEGGAPEDVLEKEYKESVDRLSRSGVYERVLKNEEYKDFLETEGWSERVISEDFMEARRAQGLPVDIVGPEKYSSLLESDLRKKKVIEEAFAPAGRIYDRATAEVLPVPGENIESAIKSVPKGLGKYTIESEGPGALRLNKVGMDILKGKNTKWHRAVENWLTPQYREKIKDLNEAERRELVARFKQYRKVSPNYTNLEESADLNIDFEGEDLSGVMASENEVAQLVGEGGLSYENPLDVDRVTAKEIETDVLSRELARTHARTGAFVGENSLLERGMSRKEIEALPLVTGRTRYLPGVEGEEDFFRRILPSGRQVPTSLQYLDLSRNVNLETTIKDRVFSSRNMGLYSSSGNLENVNVDNLESISVFRSSKARRAAKQRARGKEAMARMEAEAAYKRSLPVPVGKVTPLTRTSQGRAKRQASDTISKINEEIKLIALQPESVKPLSFERFLLSDRNINAYKYPGTKYGISVKMGDKTVGTVPYGAEWDITQRIKAGRRGSLINELAEAQEVRGFVKKSGWELNPKLAKDKLDAVIWADIYARNKEGIWIKHADVPISGVKYNMDSMGHLLPEKVAGATKEFALPKEATLLDREISAQMTQRASRAADEMARVESENMARSAGKKLDTEVSETISKASSKWKLPGSVKYASILAGIGLSAYLISRMGKGKEPMVGEAGEIADKSLYGGLSGKVLYPEGMEEQQKDQNAPEIQRQPNSYAARVQDPSSYQTNIRISGKTKYKSDYAAVGNALGQMMANEHGARSARVNVRSTDDTRKMNDESIKRKIARLT